MKTYFAIYQVWHDQKGVFHILRVGISLAGATPA